MVKIEGSTTHLNRLQAMASPSFRKKIGAAVYAAVDLIRTEAALSITQGSISGKGHVPSAPGEPPNRDTGQLDTNIVTVRTGDLKAEVQSNAPYSAALEFGTSKMAERPFLRPAAQKHRPSAQKLVVEVVNRELRRK